ncbi:MAG: 3-phosphoserine/phosphohydroxythreonine transaminase [Myxococcales bacterium]|nr:3-phosphoserine/phosphohydroxythreonine transaminase [Myxococcales bacterium]
MTASERPGVIRNFSAGPAILPPVVLDRAAEAVRELRLGGHDPEAPGIGLSLLEISHRSKPYDLVTKGAEELCHEVLGIPRTHQVLFLQGGASLQFAMVPMNLRREGKAACYIDTGTWSSKAIDESKLLGETRVIASSAETKYDRIPAMPAADAYAGASYLHITSNNTIYGTEWAAIPDAGEVPLVVDCSSDIGAQPVAMERIALGYAGAQKNLGPSGVTLVFIHRDLLAEKPAGVVPKYLRYATHAKEPSLYNTPNTFGVLVLKVMLEWMRGEGGVPALGERNHRKAAKLYAALDASALYTPHAQAGSRSLMNVTWTLGGAPEAEREALTARFVKEATAAGLDGLKGHRSVGGLRASIYNAFPEAGVDELIAFMREFERTA